MKSVSCSSGRFARIGALFVKSGTVLMSGPCPRPPGPPPWPAAPAVPATATRDHASQFLSCHFPIMRGGHQRPAAGTCCHDERAVRGAGLRRGKPVGPTRFVHDPHVHRDLVGRRAKRGLLGLDVPRACQATNGRWIRRIVGLLEERVWRSIHPLTAGRVPMFFEHLGHSYSIYCGFLQSCQYGHAPPYTLACRSADRLTDNVSLGDVPPGAAAARWVIARGARCFGSKEWTDGSIARKGASAA